MVFRVTDNGDRIGNIGPIRAINRSILEKRNDGQCTNLVGDGRAGCLFGLAGRAWRSKNAVQKWGGLILSGLLALALGLVSVVVLIGLIKTYAPRSAEIPDLQVEGTPARIQRGEHIAGVFCASCHSTNNELPLTGGVDLGKDFPMSLGSFVSVNLAPAGPAAADWA
jgi:hypothetical protein